MVTLDFSFPGPDWRPQLREAVLGAEARQPAVSFSVVTPVPANASRDVQDAFTRHGQEDAALVAQALQADGVPPERITIAFRGDPGSPRREVRVYAR